MIRRIRSRRFNESANDWLEEFKNHLSRINDEVDKLDDSLKLISEEYPEDCLQDAADCVEPLAEFLRDFGAYNLYKRDFEGFDIVSVKENRDSDGRRRYYVKLEAVLDNLQERINDSIETSSGKNGTRNFVWYAFTSCRSKRGSWKDDRAVFEVDLTVVCSY